MASRFRCDITIGIPTYDGRIPYETWRCIKAAEQYLMNKGFVAMETVQRGSCPGLLKQRHNCALAALEAQAKYLMFIDTDMVFPEYAISRLIERKTDIVGGLYVSKQPPYRAIAAQRNEDGTDKPFTAVEGGGYFDDLIWIGTGFLLIDTDVFRKMQLPYFAAPWDDKLQDYIGEDQFFCKKAKQSGYKICLDSTFPVGHTGECHYTVEHNTAYRHSEEKHDNG